MPSDTATLPALLQRNRERHGSKRGCRHRRRRDHPRRARSREPCPCGPASSRRASARASRVGVMLPNGIDWAVMAAAVMRIGAVLVPLSTLLRPPELDAQLRLAGGHASRAWPASSVGGRISTTSRRSRPGIAADVACRWSPCAPARAAAVWVADELPQPAVDDALVGALGGGGTAGRRPRRALHVRQPRRAEGDDPHARRRAARGRVGARRAPRRRRRAAVHPDAVLLDRRLRQRAARPRSSPGRRCSPRRCRSRSARSRCSNAST